VVTPTDIPVQRPRADGTLVKALARAFRWKRMLESGEFATVKELAEHEKLGFSYMTRVLRLSLLAPDIVEAILEGQQSLEMKLADLLEPFPVVWEGQIELFCRFPVSNVCHSSKGNQVRRVSPNDPSSLKQPNLED